MNLRNKSNCFLNEQLSKDEYNKRVSEIMGSSERMAQFRKEFDEFALKFPRRENNNLQSVDSTGDYLSECKNVKDSFEILKSEDCRYTFSSKLIKDSIGTIGYGTNCERLLECVAVGYSTNIVGTYGAEN